MKSREEQAIDRQPERNRICGIGTIHSFVFLSPHPPSPPLPFTAPLPPFLFTVFTPIMEENVNNCRGPDAIKGNQLSNKILPLMSTAIGGENL